MPASLDALVAALAGKTVLVIGDVMLDEYIIGRATRMSREAPVPVLEFESKRYIAGGAANPAANIVALGSRALQIGLIGDDAAGQRLRELLRAGGIDSAGLLRCQDRPTTVKTRILAQMGLRFPQQVTRIDTLSRCPIEAATVARIMDFLRQHIETVDVALLSHYHGDLLTAALVAEVRQLCAQTGTLLTADAQGSFANFAGLDVIKCNAADAARYLQRPLQSEADFRAAALELHESLEVRKAMIITRGSQGATLAADGVAEHCPAPKVSDVYDTVGAGDTAIAVISLAMAGGRGPRPAVMLANHASGIVVRHLGNYAPTPAELWASIRGAL